VKGGIYSKKTQSTEVVKTVLPPAPVTFFISVQPYDDCFNAHFAAINNVTEHNMEF